MSDIIKLLPDHVANQIAAGEVIQRPASVVKELLDNAIDAQSSEIKLILRDAGKALVQVIDNGIGMSPTDARMCWERHATSKISSSEDIFKIKTMGFRGEALASMASVAHVELKTKREEDSLGTLILIEGSEVKKQENIAASVGTSIAVKNLFFNVPARRNFLKSNPVELRHIIDEFTRAALANPQIAFSLWHNDDESFNLKKASQLQRICDIYADKNKDNLLPCEEETSIINVSGYIGKPELAKKMRGEQFFFVNKRFIKDAYLNHAVTSSFEGMISKEQYPFYCIFIDINPAQIDINIHPTKTELKFEDEKNVYQIIRAITRKALGDFHVAPKINEFDDNQFMNFQIKQSDYGNMASQQNSQNDATIREERNYGRGSDFVKKDNNQDWKQIYEIARSEKSSRPQLFELPGITSKIAMPEPEPETTAAQSIFQLHNAYIVSQVKSGLMLIDQQAAHERILYEKNLYALQKNPAVSQQKLFPKAVHLNAGDESILLEILPEIRALGFDINEFGKNTFVLNGVPAELNHVNEEQVLQELIENYKNTRGAQNNKHESVARSLAKQAAVKAGSRLSLEEMNQLIDELFACKEPTYSPDGKPCLKMLSLDDVRKLF